MQRQEFHKACGSLFAKCQRGRDPRPDATYEEATDRLKMYIENRLANNKMSPEARLLMMQKAKAKRIEEVRTKKKKKKEPKENSGKEGDGC